MEDLRNLKLKCKLLSKQLLHEVETSSVQNSFSKLVLDAANSEVAELNNPNPPVSCEPSQLFGRLASRIVGRAQFEFVPLKILEIAKQIERTAKEIRMFTFTSTSSFKYALEEFAYLPSELDFELPDEEMANAFFDRLEHKILKEVERMTADGLSESEIVLNISKNKTLELLRETSNELKRF